MILQFDQGNSATKWRLLKGREIVARGFFGNDEPLPAALIDRLAEADQIQISSVAHHRVTQALANSLARLGGAEIIRAESQSEQLGLRNAYPVPSQMGVDRWLAMLGAWHEDRMPLVVVDAGSAITIDVIGAEGLHEGGFILPGRGLMLASLQAGTSRVLFEMGDDTGVEPGTDTQSCVSRGLFLLWRGLVAEIEAIAAARRIERVWVSGGDAGRLQLAGLQAHFRQDLVLDGLSVYCADPEVTGAG